MSDFFDRFSKVPTSQKVLLLLLVVAALFIVFYMFFYNDLEQRIVEAREQQEQLSSEQARLAGLQERVRDLELRVADELRAREDQSFSEDLPVSDDIPNLLDELHQTASIIATSERGTRLEIREVRPRPQVPEAEYTRIPVELNLTGTFDQVLAFCWELARMSRIVHVRSVDMTLSGNRQAPGPPVLRVNLALEAFFRPQG
jgi:type IV pilus assembly protein PilO